MFITAAYWVVKGAIEGVNTVSPFNLIFLLKNGKQTVFFILLFDGVDSYLIVVLFSIKICQW